MNAGKQYGTVKNVNINSALNQKAASMAFWTCCQFCGMRYKYLIEYVNRILRCQSCHKSFTAYDMGFEILPPGSNPAQAFSRKEVPSHGLSSRVQSSHVKPSGVQHASKPPTGLGQASKPVTMAGIKKTPTREEKIGVKDVGVGKNDVERPKPDAAAKSRFEVKEPEATAAKSKPSRTRSKPDILETDEMDTSTMRERKKKRTAVEESSESFDASNCGDGKKEENVQESVDNPVGRNSEENQKRRSSRNKRQVSYTDNGSDDDFANPPPKKTKARMTADPDSEAKEPASAGGLSGNTKVGVEADVADECEKGIKEKANFMCEESSLNKDNGVGKPNSGCVEETTDADTVSKSHENVMLEPELLIIPDPEFGDFEKDKSMDSFAVNQVWAIYDPADGMPRFYARVRKVFTPGFKLKITWLEPLLDNQEERESDEEEEDMPVACGKFENGETEVTEDLPMFSHQMHCSYNKKCTLIYPKKGETWALFRDWDISWNTDPEKRKPPYRYDFVEILSVLPDNLGIGVGYLGKVKGFVSLFERAVQHGVLAFHIPPCEIYRFSHRVPSFRMTGKEKEGVPADSFELDPAALPNNMFELGHSSRVKPEKKSLGSDIDGINSPKKCQKTDKSEDEASNGICKNWDQAAHAYRCMNDEDKDVTSKRNSDSFQDSETNAARKPEKGKPMTEALNLRRSPRRMGEKDCQANASRSTDQDTDKAIKNEKQNVPTQFDDKTNTTLKKIDMDNSVTESLRHGRSLQGLNKTDAQPNGSHCATENTIKLMLNSNPNKHENNDGLSPLSNGSNGVLKDLPPCGRTGEGNWFDFKKERSEEKFQVNQIWALYSKNDGMPKEYAQIKKVETAPDFRLHVVLLEACSPPKYTTNTVCCGLFKVKSARTKTLPSSSFSHLMQAMEFDKNKYEIYPRKGEIWALYKNGNSDERDVAKVLEDDGQIIKLASLKCVNGSKSLYKVLNRQGSAACTIDLPRTEVGRFSHRIPAFEHTSKKDCLRGCWELDPSAVPSVTIILD